MHEEDFFFLPAYFETMTQSGKSSHYLFTGRCGKTLHFTNENLFEKYPESTLLFFDNVDVSSYINLRMKESKFLTYENYIPICHYGNLSMVEINDINFGVAKYRKVVLCPGPSRESYMNMFRYAREFQNVKCESVTVLQFPLLAHSKYVDFDTSSLPDPFERYVLENSLCINEIDAADIRRRIDNSCISLEVFKKKCTEMMLLKEEEQTCPSWLEMKSAEDIIRIVSIEKKDDVATLDKLINPSDITMIVGPSNAGKEGVQSFV